MINELCVAISDFDSLKASLLHGEEERCAVLLASKSRRSDGTIRFLVREIRYPEPPDYLYQSSHGAQLSPSFVAKASKAAKTSGLSLVFVHTHPGNEPPTFSRVDDDGEKVLSQFLNNRLGPARHAALVLSRGGCRARFLGTQRQLRVITVGSKRAVVFDSQNESISLLPMFDRQVRAFGKIGQQRLNDLSIAIVGLGGTGSIAAQQLAHLGVSKYILIDPDVIEDTNLNRVVGATVTDVGATKVSIAARYIRHFNSRATVKEHVGDVVHNTVAQTLIDADFIFSCTDSHGSRSVIQQIAYQHLIPCIDMGSTIIQEDGHVQGIFGRVQMLAPGLACLWCSSLLDPDEVRRDMMNETERRLDPYIPGSREPAPSVISLNGTVVSLAVSMLLGAVSGAPFEATHLIYNGCASTLRPVHNQAQQNCFICSRAGSLAWGSDRKLFTRRD